MASPPERAARAKPERKAPKFRSGHVALVGRPNVGKSTFLNTALGERLAIVSHHPQTTRDRLLGVLTSERAQIAFLDTPGVHAPKNELGARMIRETEDAISGADLVVFVTDVGKSTKDALHPGDADVLAKIPAKTPVLLVLNKIDRVPDKTQLVPILEAAAKVRDFVAFVPISALAKDGVKRVVSEIEKHLPVGPMLYEDDTLTDRPARWVVAELVREQVLAKTRAEIPHGVAVVVEGWAEPSGKRKKMTEIDVAIHVPKESHKKILVGRAGAMTKEIGTRARGRVERMLGQPVVLRLWVRVTEDWYESAERLRELGYGEGEST
jgi:GTP-binding protein Era